MVSVPLIAPVPTGPGHLVRIAAPFFVEPRTNPSEGGAHPCTAIRSRSSSRAFSTGLPPGGSPIRRRPSGGRRIASALTTIGWCCVCPSTAPSIWWSVSSAAIASGPRPWTPSVSPPPASSFGAPVGPPRRRRSRRESPQRRRRRNRRVSAPGSSVAVTRDRGLAGTDLKGQPAARCATWPSSTRRRSRQWILEEGEPLGWTGRGRRHATRTWIDDPVSNGVVRRHPCPPAYSGEETHPLHPVTARDAKGRLHTLLYGFLPLGGQSLAMGSPFDPGDESAAVAAEHARLPWPFGYSVGPAPFGATSMTRAGGRRNSNPGVLCPAGGAGESLSPGRRRGPGARPAQGPAERGTGAGGFESDVHRRALTLNSHRRPA